MSRSGYNDDYGNNWDLIKYRGQVESAIRGKRGQQFLRDLIAALDAMPEKKLIANDLKKDGCVCALGAALEKRGIDPEPMDPEDGYQTAKVLNIAEQLANEVMFLNDDYGSWGSTPGADVDARRWLFMRIWAERNLKKEGQNEKQPD